jgi:hypothetical protein
MATLRSFECRPGAAVPGGDWLAATVRYRDRDEKWLTAGDRRRSICGDAVMRDERLRSGPWTLTGASRAPLRFSWGDVLNSAGAVVGVKRDVKLERDQMKRAGIVLDDLHDRVFERAADVLDNPDGSFHAASLG